MPWLFVVIFVAYLLWSVFKILKEYERGVIFRLGRLVGTRGPGLIILIPGIEKMVKVSLRLVTLDVPPQDIITKDNVSVKVNAVVYFRVMNPDNAIVEVEDFFYATSQLAQTTMRSVCGEAELDDLLAEREKLNFKLQEILDKQTDPWGIKVTNVEIKHIELSDEMKRAMAKQAEAERERRAKVIHATGEFQAATKLSEAAEIMSNPVSLQLRYLQTLTEVAVEKNSTLVFPLPIDLLKPFMEVKKKLEQGD
jgi:regulator of protease activity HflC (stomatin/prohibitin superfamily)